MGVPPVLFIYDKITGLEKVAYLGAARNESFGDSIEVGIAIDLKDLKKSTIDQFIDPIKRKLKWSWEYFFSAFFIAKNHFLEVGEVT